MAGSKFLPIDWAHFTGNHAEIMEAYFSLLQEREATTIGTGEIVQWMRARRRTPPSESLIRTVLGHAQVPRRSDGRPSLDSRQPPLLSVVENDPPPTPPKRR